MNEHVRGELVEDGPRRRPLARWAASSPVEEVIELVPAIGRLTAAAWLRSAVLGVEAGVKVGARVVRVVLPPDAIAFGQELGSALRDYTQGTSRHHGDRPAPARAFAPGVRGQTGRLVASPRRRPPAPIGRA